MRIVLLALFFSFVFFNVVSADDRKNLFEGFDAKIETIVDDMTDVKSGVIFYHFGPVYMAVYGSNNFAIFANLDDLNFAFDSKHLVRVGENRPFALHLLNKQNALKPDDATEAEAVIESLAKGEEVKLRYYTWPKHDQVDMKLQNPNFGFVYHKAAKSFGWNDFGVSPDLGPVKLDIYESPDPEQKGYVDISVRSNGQLGLNKNFDKYGGGATIGVGVYSGFGFHEGRWICGTVAYKETKHLIIRDSNGHIVFKESLPSEYSLNKRALIGETWAIGKIAAEKAWVNSPFGSIEIEGELGKKVSLYGFRELWQWGTDNAGFPKLEISN